MAMSKENKRKLQGCGFISWNWKIKQVSWQPGWWDCKLIKNIRTFKILERSTISVLTSCLWDDILNQNFYFYTSWCSALMRESPSDMVFNNTKNTPPYSITLIYCKEFLHYWWPVSALLDLSSSLSGTRSYFHIYKEFGDIIPV